MGNPMPHDEHKAPFPYAGGKSTAAKAVWAALWEATQVKTILFSGGIDSTLLASWSEPGDLLVSVNYGQSNIHELEVAQATARKLGRETVRIQATRIIPTGDVYPGRNALLLALAAGMAQARGSRLVQIGCNADDRANFPDCSPHFIGSMSAALLAGYGVGVDAPLLYTPRSRVVELWRATGLDAWSCYRPHGMDPCGECLACRSR
jgi:7-cyano-7-deazaguanine synthase